MPKRRARSCALKADTFQDKFDHAHNKQQKHIILYVSEATAKTREEPTQHLLIEHPLDVFRAVFVKLFIRKGALPFQHWAGKVDIYVR
jgi:hypothetical protein